MSDLVAEAHDVHHPIASSLYYEDQKGVARRRAADFRSNRLPKYLHYFERILERNPRGAYLSGAKLSYADLSMYQVLCGLQYAFSRAMKACRARYPLLESLQAQVAALPRIRAYLRSKRRLPFNRQDVFRNYPELDTPRRRR